eukprot:TRINITY_DN2072_c1_g2_i1.p1 TRINITY_DN2072_c1_g2~~TRINITY_DN2072_c1_g2_i1.p1  ORF type:complete len:400 (+),score=141.12 TRINITY_DN2072_c1_g2_i1:28-1200(+)
MSKIYRRGERPELPTEETKPNEESYDLKKIISSQNQEEPVLSNLERELEDTRLRRLREAQSSQTQGGSHSDLRSRRQRIAEVIEDDEDEGQVVTVTGRRGRGRVAESSDDEDDMGAMPVTEEDDGMAVEESSESESSYETETDEEDDDMDMFDEPVVELKFVRKDRRKTVKTEDEIAEEKAEQEEREKEDLEERRKRTLVLLKQKVVEEESEDSSFDFSSSEEDDEETKQKEFELWKLRELRRIKREFEEIEAHKMEEAEKLRRQNMTDEEIERENEQIGRGEKERTEMRFLQKYYHKGAFFAEEMKDIHESHDWALPTGEDKQDRTILPAVMQVKRYGLASRTKYTHLTAEDTSIHDDYWRNEHTVRSGYQQKLAGTRNLVRPRKQKKT